MLICNKITPSRASHSPGRGREQQSSSPMKTSRLAQRIPLLLTTGRLEQKWLVNQSIVLSGSSAILGPLCDNFHSQFHVLKYSNTQKIDIMLPLDLLHLESTWWTPVLFGVAGVILGVSHPLLDELIILGLNNDHTAAIDATTKDIFFSIPRGGANPSWPFILLCIACFVLIYYASACLEAPLLDQTLPNTPIPTLDAILCICSIALWATFDGTKQGAFIALLAGVCGPLVESLLISQGLYSYSHPSQLNMLGNIPTWIPWVYFSGGPAVGNLGRKTSHEILSKRPFDVL